MAQQKKALSRNRIRLTLVGILILAVAAVFVVIPDGPDLFGEEVKVHLGLDLQGGAHLVYQTDVSSIPSADQESAVDGTRDVIERRVNALGVSEPLVQTNKTDAGYRLIVELPGVTDVNDAIRQIGETPVLEFKTIKNSAPEESELTPVQLEEQASFNAAQLDRADATLEKVLKSPNTFEDNANLLSEDPGNTDPEGNKNGGDLGWARRGMFVDEFEAALFDELADSEIKSTPVETQFGWHLIQRIESRPVENGEEGEIEVHGRHILFAKWQAPQASNAEWENTELSGKHLSTSTVQFDPTSGQPTVTLQFNDEGAELFEQITDANIGRQVAIFLDGFVISAPTVQQKITGGQAVISGSFTIVEARELASRLNAGALPVPITLLSQQTVGPSLGQLSLEKSLVAALVGLILVIIFMVGFYRFPGVIAVLALAIYGAVVVAIFKLVPVTLTLSGIAGFILSLGMAVDANVLIFERIKEELYRGQSMKSAIEDGFHRAWTAIRDGNISTLITAFILLTFGTSLIKGFALTLGIGVLVSMFSAITVSRILLLVFSSAKPLQADWLWGIKRKNVSTENS
ncbi:MAG: protein translocase subunit SecD [Candidatus Jacksonbacteria bacterium]|jgi:protein-export membrane protein SecD|nr:protein translocase subunit SecD [Candidatus Jacksonbacteria bacterium]MBT6034277.1 protein translocase subunit SecD [Candidatus Jacksonbacteria bacterium]MBT6757753.1 protein translocase subunit SecD [Candidatus Jacksonbacteria bacterium]MBT6955470.1 protein translocase subunit SecD [Candidatus Jacksonbacteria bacterium]